MQSSLVVLGLFASASARTLLNGGCSDVADSCSPGGCCLPYACNLNDVCADPSDCKPFGMDCKPQNDVKWLCCPGLLCSDQTDKCVECDDTYPCAEGQVCEEGKCVAVLPCGGGCDEFKDCDGTLLPFVCVDDQCEEPTCPTPPPPECLCDDLFKDCYGTPVPYVCVEGKCEEPTCPPPPECVCDDKFKDCYGTPVPYVCEDWKCVEPTCPPPPPPPQCADLGEGCSKTEDCCYYDGVFCDYKTWTCSAPEIIVTEESEGTGDTLSLGGGTISDADVNTGGSSDPFGFISNARTKTGGVAFGGGQQTFGKANARGGFSLGLFGRKPEILGATEGKAKATGQVVGDYTVTDTNTKSVALGSTGQYDDYDYPFVGQDSRAKSTTLAAGKDIAGESKSNTAGNSVLLTPDTASLATGRSRNTAGFFGAGLGFSTTKGTTKTQAAPGLSASRSTGYSASGIKYVG